MDVSGNFRTFVIPKRERGGATPTSKDNPNDFFTMATINIIKSSDKVSAETPYNKTYIKMIKEIGGKWDPANKVWIVPTDKEQDLRKILLDVYGWEEQAAEETLRVRLDGRYYETRQGVITIGDILVAKRWRRYGGVTLYNGAELIEGDFGWDGRSNMRPRVIGKDTTDTITIEMELSRYDYDRLDLKSEDHISIVED